MTKGQSLGCKEVCLVLIEAANTMLAPNLRRPVSFTGMCVSCAALGSTVSEHQVFFSFSALVWPGSECEKAEAVVHLCSAVRELDTGYFSCKYVAQTDPRDA